MQKMGGIANERASPVQRRICGRVEVPSESPRHLHRRSNRTKGKGREKDSTYFVLLRFLCSHPDSAAPLVVVSLQQFLRFARPLLRRLHLQYYESRGWQVTAQLTSLYEMANRSDLLPCRGHFGLDLFPQRFLKIHNERCYSRSDIVGHVTAHSKLHPQQTFRSFQYTMFTNQLTLEFFYLWSESTHTQMRFKCPSKHLPGRANIRLLRYVQTIGLQYTGRHQRSG